ncbi:mucin-binding protein, partial [Oenococcus oeni]|uniref:mucin-binding protein n=1 Tax=Oenococcus oeni TaxID=1247 RepID=UPI000B1627CD
PQNGTLTQSGNNGTVIYVYAPAYTVSSTKTVNETINYVDQNGKTVANSYKATPITFITVTNPVDGAETVYYSTTATSAELNPETGVPEGSDWTQANSDDFASVTNPTVAGYSVISNNAPASDLAHVASQTVTNTSDDLNYTVVYAPAYTVSSTKTVNETINYVDQNGKTVANSYKATPITFITVTNPVDGAETVYYSTTATSAELNPETGVPEGSDWTQAN